MLRNGIRELERRRQAWTLHRPLLHRSARAYIATQIAVATPDYLGGDVAVRVKGHDRISHSSAPRHVSSPSRRPRPPVKNSLNELFARRWNTDPDLPDPGIPERSFPKRRHRSVSYQERRSLREDTSSTNSLVWAHASRKLSKSWRYLSPNLLLKRILEPHPDSREWRHRVAVARSNRLPIILLQMFLRSEAAQPDANEAILEHLPSSRDWQGILAIMRSNGYNPEKLESLLSVLQGATDEERCRRALELKFSVPNFVLNFLIRSTSTISKISTLSSMIDLWRKSCENSLQDAREEKAAKARARASSVVGHRRQKRTTVLAPSDFDLTTNLLAYHCTCIEPRLLLKLADVAMEYIRGVATISGPSEKYYQSQCALFNNTLRAFQPQLRLQAIQISSPNAYLWEAQRVLLAMSAETERPLLVNREGFQAIRVVLSGLVKNRTETRNARRHATTWPPYLEPADGMDEVADPEDNWSRAVSAGALMQEAGFCKEDRDEAMDILGGMATDGSPTIQQRTAISRERSLSSWEASIRATRNAHEAWHRFRSPPEAGLRPGVAHYAAMFEKLVLREVEAHTRVLPGDKAINFPVRQESNLTEFEQARLQPPSVAQLYERMLGEGIRPSGNCLHVLVANASSIETARVYIDHSPEDHDLKDNLYRRNPDPVLLRELDCGLVAAYIQALTAHAHKRRGNQMLRAIRLARNLVGTSKSPLAQGVWGTILKNLSQHAKAMGVNLGQQLRLALYAVEQMGGRDGVTLKAFLQFSRCLRKAVRREVEELAKQVAADEASAVRNPLVNLYNKGGSESTTADGDKVVSPRAPKEALLRLGALLKDDFAAQSADMLFRIGAARMKELHDALRNQEWESKRILDTHGHKHRVAALDRVAWRKDLFRSDHAHEYLLSLAYAGEFEEMATVLQGLVARWSGEEGVEAALLEVDELPGHADFFEALCAFRLLAEPMLDEDTVGGLREAVGRVGGGLGWEWPDGRAMEMYVDMQEEESTAMLARVLKWVREKGRVSGEESGQQQEQGQEEKHEVG